MKQTTALERETNNLQAWSHDIRNASINNTYETMKYWLQVSVNSDASNDVKYQQIINQYNLLLEVICDECLPVTYRKTGLKLINYPLFWLKECEEIEENKPLLSEFHNRIKQMNTKIYYEFQQTYNFYKKSLGD